MQINPIQNYNQQINKNPEFKGALGKEVVKKFSDTKISAGEERMSDALKALGIGSLGVISLSKFKDIMEEVSAKFEFDKQQMKDMQAEKKKMETAFSVKEMELDNRKRDFDGFVAGKKAEFDEISADFKQKKIEFEGKLAEFKEKSKAFDLRAKNMDKITEERNNNFAQKEKAAQELYENKQNELVKREQNIIKLSRETNEALDKRERALDEREQNLKVQENELRDILTPKIHVEERLKVQQELAGRLEALDILEQEIEKKEKAVINAEYLIKDAEKEKIMSEFRVMYDIKDIDTAADYDTVSEQILMLTSILDNNRTSHLENFDSDDFTKIMEVMRNKEGVISGKMLQFLERAVNISDDWNMDELTYALEIVKDNFGNIDTEKAAAFIAFLLLPKSNMEKAADKMLENYKDISLKRNHYTIVHNSKKISVKRRDFDRYNNLLSQINEEEDRIKSIIDGDPTLISLKKQIQRDEHWYLDSNAKRTYQQHLEMVNNDFPIKSCRETIAELQNEIKNLIEANQ